MSGSHRFAYRELTRALAVEPGMPQSCRVCGAVYVPEGPLYLTCADCFERLRRVMSHRDMVLGIGLRVLAARRDADAAHATRASSRSP